MPAVQGGRALLRVRVGGFPVRLDWSFVIIVGLLGYYPGVSASSWLLWLLIAPLAVLAHELGHAVAARGTGAAPEIVLAGLGGLTTYQPSRPLGRARSIGISLAGPAVGLALGAGLLGYQRTVGLTPGTLAEQAWSAAVFTTLGWSLLNLLPILPLDGGQALREMLPGDGFARQRGAAIVSVVVGAGVALLAARSSYTFGALMAGLLVLNNLALLRQRRPEPLGLQTQLANLLWEGRTVEAVAALDAHPSASASVEATGQLDPLLRAAVLAIDPARAETGRQLLDREARARPGDAEVVAVLTLVALLRHDWESVISLVSRTEAPFVPAALVARAQQEAERAGRPDLGAEVGETWLDAVGAPDGTAAASEEGVEVPDGAPEGAAEVPDGAPEGAAEVAYGCARGRAAAGEVDAGVAALLQAAALGFTDLARLDIDPALQRLRGMPGYLQARQRVRQTALAAETAASQRWDAHRAQRGEHPPGRG